MKNQLRLPWLFQSLITTVISKQQQPFVVCSSSSFLKRIQRGGSSIADTSITNNNTTSNLSITTTKAKNIINTPPGLKMEKATTKLNEVDNYSDDSEDIVVDEHAVIGGGAINEKERIYLRNENEQQQAQEQDNNDGGDNDDNSRSSTTTTEFEPSKHRSHLYHAIEGLDRYPNYLSRWTSNVEDIDKLEIALQSEIDKVRKQKQDILTKQQFTNNTIHNMLKSFDNNNEEKKNTYQQLLLTPPKSWNDLIKDRNVLHPKIIKAVFQSKQFRAKQQSSSSLPPALDVVLSGNINVELDAHLLQDIMDQELYDVYSIPLLSPEFCNLLVNYIRDISLFDTSTSFGSKPINLDLIGLSWINDLLFHLIVKPLSQHLYKETDLNGGTLDWRHGFVAGYSSNPTSGEATPRQKLVIHTDDSEITLNLCLSDDFDGGLVNFYGLRGSSSNKQKQKLIDTYQPKKGVCLLHSGRHFHEVTPITNGNRYVLIMWTRSWSKTRKDACPCCWLNNRHSSNNADDNSSSSCICSWKWN